MARGKEIKVGVIGYGPAYGMGKYHFDNMRVNKGLVPWAVCDLDESRLAVAREEFPGVETYTRLEDMLSRSEVELLVVILPHNLHASVAVQCLNAGRHVVVEKPFAITVAECDRMIAAAKKNKVMLSTFHNRHWDANILTIMKHLRKIGRPYRWESFFGGWEKPLTWWRSDKKISGGQIYDWGAHFTEWMLQVMNDDIVSISGFSIDEVWKHVTNEDEVEAVVRFKNGSIGSHTQTQLAAAGKPHIRICGTEGAITWENNQTFLHKVDKAGNKTITVLKSEARADHLYYANVRDHLLKGKDLIITPEWARRVIQVLDFACRAAKTGKPLAAKYK